MPAKKTD